MAPAYIPDTKEEVVAMLSQGPGAPAARASNLKVPDLSLEPGSMTPPQRHKLGGALAALTSPSVKEILRTKETAEKAFIRDIADLNQQ